MRSVPTKEDDARPLVAAAALGPRKRGGREATGGNGRALFLVGGENARPHAAAAALRPREGGGNEFTGGSGPALSLGSMRT